MDKRKKKQKIIINTSNIEKICCDNNSHDIPIYVSDKYVTINLEKIILPEDITDHIPIYNTFERRKIINKKILILSGGGVKGIAHIGALKALSENHILDTIETFVGSSIGAIVCALYVIGITPDEMFDFIKAFDLSKIKSVHMFDFIQKYGFDNGIKLEFLLYNLFQLKDNKFDITFKELFEKTKKKLIITTTCVNDKKVRYLSHETSPDMPIIIALRMSTCIPLFYTPVNHQNMLYIDGGCIDNYPINLFNDRLEEVIGIYLTDIRSICQKIDNLESYLFNVIQCLMEGVTFNSVKGYEKYTISVKLDQVNIANFKIDIDKKIMTYKAGYDAVINYLNEFEK